MIHLQTIVGLLLSFHILIAESCLRSQKNPDNFLCKSASNRMEFRILTGTAIDQEYFYRITEDKLIFYVKASSDAEIFFHTSPVDKPPLLKITIGRNDNSYSTIEEITEENTATLRIITTPDILAAWQYRGFWISFDRGTVAVGKESEKKPFMMNSNNLIKYSLFISFRTPLDETGEWIIVRGIMQDLRAGWCDRTNTIDPRNNAAKVDVTEDKHIYVCRSITVDELVPGYAKSPNGGCKFERFGSKKSKKYQLLLGDTLIWKTVDNNLIPTNAAVGGLTDQHQPLFICRFQLDDGRIIIGSINNDGRRCWAATKNSIYYLSRYDILIQDIPSTYRKNNI